MIDKQKDKINMVMGVVGPQIDKLNQLEKDGQISKHDRVSIGMVMCTHASTIVNLSDKAWEIFKAIVDESRAAEKKWEDENG